MKPVKHLQVVLLDDNICYGPEKGQNNITPEMREKWDKVFSQVEVALRKRAFVTERTVTKREDAVFTFIVDVPIFFCESLVILDIIEKLFKVTSFSFNTERDEWNDEDPCLRLGIYSNL